MFSRNPRPNPSRPPPGQPGPYDRVPSTGDDRYDRYLQPDNRSYNNDRAPEKHDSHREQLGNTGRSVSGGQHAAGQVWQLRPAKSPANQFTFGNL